MKLSFPKPVSEKDTSNASAEVTYPVIVRPIDESSSVFERNQPLESEVKHLYLDDCKQEGFVPGAVVVHSRTAILKRTDPKNWGIITELNSPASIIGEWCPIQVRWINGSYEDCHSKELRLLIYKPDENVLKRRATHNEV